jgi:hypothetical protein
MKIRNINDKNCMVEVLLEYFMRHQRCEAESIGNLKTEPDFKMYTVRNRMTDRFVILTTDLELYNDKRVKDDRKKEKRSVVFLRPVPPKYQRVSEEAQYVLDSFFNGGETDLTLEDTDNVDLIKEYLKKA